MNPRRRRHQRMRRKARKLRAAVAEMKAVYFAILAKVTQ